MLKFQFDTHKFSVVPKILENHCSLPAKMRLSSSMKHSEQLWDHQASYSFPQVKAVDHHSKHSASFLHLWMCGATCLLIPYLHDMVSNLWNRISSVCVMQCHAQTSNIRLRWLSFSSRNHLNSGILWLSLYI